MKYLDYGVCAFILSTKPAQEWWRAKGYDRILEKSNSFVPFKSFKSFVLNYERIDRLLDFKENLSKYRNIIKYANEFLISSGGQVWLSSEDGQKFRALEKQHLICDTMMRLGFHRRGENWTAEEEIQYLWDKLNNSKWLHEMEFKDHQSCYFILETHPGKECIGLVRDECTIKQVITWANEFINTPQGQAWFNSEDGQKFEL